jgi:hypothetical protein
VVRFHERADTGAVFHGKVFTWYLRNWIFNLRCEYSKYPMLGDTCLCCGSGSPRTTSWHLQFTTQVTPATHELHTTSNILHLAKNPGWYTLYHRTSPARSSIELWGDNPEQSSQSIRGLFPSFRIAFRNLICESIFKQEIWSAPTNTSTSLHKLAETRLFSSHGL